ncbi:hypothetical protein AB3K25_00510 [Leuconostoc sp. MS02]|uniref:Uncharacterized protein n=1 Tax=Leuconostoc aquikimchii TaxID=3236804 RepID=A0ABV3S545_9LACO
MVKVNMKLWLTIFLVMIMLTSLLYHGETPIYFIDYGAQPLLAKMTYFGLLMSPILIIIGNIAIWQTGAYLNRLIRVDNILKLVIVSYFKNLMLVIAAVALISVGNQLLLNTEQLLPTVNLFVSYSLYVAVYMLLEALFNSGTAILMISGVLLILVIGSGNFGLLGTIVFQTCDAFWQPIVTIFGTGVVLIILYKTIQKKDFYGEG